MNLKEFSEAYGHLITHYVVDQNNDIYAVPMYQSAIELQLQNENTTKDEYERVINFVNDKKYCIKPWNFEFSQNIYKVLFNSFKDAQEYVYKQQFVIVEEDFNECLINGESISKKYFKTFVTNKKLKMIYGQFVDENTTWYGLYRWMSQ